MKSLALVTAPQQEPIALEEAMAFLRVDSRDEAPFIEALVSTAREVVENFTGRAMLSQTWRLTLSDWPSYGATYGLAALAPSFARSLTRCGEMRMIALDRSPLQSVYAVSYYPADGSALATFSANNYHVLTDTLPGLVVLKSDQSWPDLYDRPDAVQVTFIAGSADPDAVPKVLRHCVLLVLSHLFENRGAINIGNIVNELPFSLKYLLETQRVGGWVA